MKTANYVTSENMSGDRPSKSKKRKPLDSVIQRRKYVKIYNESGEDVTPKALKHDFYPIIEEHHLTAFDTIRLMKTGNGSLLSMTSGISRSNFSLISMRSSIIHTTAMPAFEGTMESLFATQEVHSFSDRSRAPSPFCLPKYEDSFKKCPRKVTIILNETETVIFFEMPQLTADLNTSEGQEVKKQNEEYEFITVGEGSKRKLAHAETQTTRIYVKTRSTHEGREKRMNKGTFVNNWVIFDTYCNLERAGLVEETLDEHKLPKISPTPKTLNNEAQLIEIYKNSSFKDLIQIMERIIASTLYLVPQKRFKGILETDSCSPDLTFTYTLDLLWTHSCSETLGRPVNAFRWNYTNPNILAIGYGSGNNATGGLLLIWCMKNPGQPDRTYKFEYPISDLDWSRTKPNQLAIGFYDGRLQIIDVSNRSMKILRDSKTDPLPLFSPQWQVQWWQKNEDQDSHENIYTSTQDGRILCYPAHEDFTSTQIMKISRIEANIPGVPHKDYCAKSNIPIRKNPGAVLIRRHPEKEITYLVGSDEGCVHHCSMNYLNNHVNSFLAHDGPIYALEFSPFCSKLFLTCGADWMTRIWIEGITEPLISFSTRMSCIRAAAWSPKNSTIIATCADNEIALWDIRRKTHKPSSKTITPSKSLSVLQFTRDGNQLVAADVSGVVYVYNLEGIPFPAFNQIEVLINSIKKSLVTRPLLLNKFTKIIP